MMTLLYMKKYADLGLSTLYNLWFRSGDWGLVEYGFRLAQPSHNLSRLESAGLGQSLQALYPRDQCLCQQKQAFHKSGMEA